MKTYIQYVKCRVSLSLSCTSRQSWTISGDILYTIPASLHLSLTHPSLISLLPLAHSFPSTPPFLFTPIPSLQPSNPPPIPSKFCFPKDISVCICYYVHLLLCYTCYYTTCYYTTCYYTTCYYTTCYSIHTVPCTHLPKELIAKLLNVDTSGLFHDVSRHQVSRYERFFRTDVNHLVRGNVFKEVSMKNYEAADVNQETPANVIVCRLLQQMSFLKS